MRRLWICKFGSLVARRFTRSGAVRDVLNPSAQQALTVRIEHVHLVLQVLQQMYKMDMAKVLQILLQK